MMEKAKSTLYILEKGITIVLLVLAAVLFYGKQDLGVSQNKTSYDVIGSATNSSTLSALFSGNSWTGYAGYMENLHLDIRYSPKNGETNRYAMIAIEGSNDGGTNWFPMANKIIGTDEVDLYASSSLSGVNLMSLVIPGDKLTIGSSTYGSQFDTDIMADYVRVSARESGSGNNGFIYVRATLSSKN